MVVGYLVTIRCDLDLSVRPLLVCDFGDQFRRTGNSIINTFLRSSTDAGRPGGGHVSRDTDSCDVCEVRDREARVEL